MIRPAVQATAAAVARHYDELDPFYRELWGEHIHHGYWATGRESPDEAVRALVDLVAARADIREGDTVCDVGSGYGGTARALAVAYGAHVVGYTLSPAQHEVARRGNGAGDVRFVLGDWLDSGLPPASFDAVIAIESTEHMADKPRFFAEAARVLRPGGRLVVCTWLATERTTANPTRLLERICEEGMLPSLGTPTEYRTMIHDAGLGAVSCEDITRQVRRTWRHCSFRILARLSRPSSWSYLLDRRNEHRVFALTVPRIWLAYAAGWLRYGVFVAARADEDEPAPVDDNFRER